MDKAAGLTLFVIISLLAGISFIQYSKNTFIQDGKTYAHSGVMKRTIDGKDIYMPIYTLKEVN